MPFTRRPEPEAESDSEDAPPDAAHIRGRGTARNPASRFDSRRDFAFDDGWGTNEEASAPQTQVFPDHSRTILAHSDSPDLGHRRTLNPYRGCEHGCVYCFARPTHNQLGLSSGLDFETRLFAKHDAPALLRQALAKPGYTPHPITVGAATDPYQPIERKLRITRGVLEVLEETAHPFVVVSKSNLAVRDLDLFASAAAGGRCGVAISITTLDRDLARRLEPRAPAPVRRLEAVRALAEAGVPVTVMAAPMIPGLNDVELESILGAAAEAGAKHAGYVLLRLPWDLKELFPQWLEAHYPDRRARVLSLLRQTRGGKLYESEFEIRRTGRGPIAELLARRFALARRRFGLDAPWPALSAAAFTPPGGLALFGDARPDTRPNTRPDPRADTRPNKDAGDAISPFARTPTGEDGAF